MTDKNPILKKPKMEGPPSTIDEGSLREIERLCEALFRNPTREVQERAEAVLAPMGQSVQFITHLQLILDRSEHGFTLLMATEQLTQLITEHWTSFESKDRVQIRACRKEGVFSLDSSAL